MGLGFIMVPVAYDGMRCSIGKGRETERELESPLQEARQHPNMSLPSPTPFVSFHKWTTSV